MQTFLYISLGAALGANARYWLSSWIMARWMNEFPVGTLVVNLSGSLLLGLLVAFTTDKIVLDPRVRMALIVGFLGSYTTFSTYASESINLLVAGEWTSAIFNLIGGAIFGGLAAGLGLYLGKYL